VAATIIDIPELREQTRVFRDREHAGERLAGLLGERHESSTCILAVPAGGVPVALAIAELLCLPLDLAVVSKITFPWNTESGYGAVAFDGTVLLNTQLVVYSSLSQAQIERGVARTRAKVERRMQRLRGSRQPPGVSGRGVIIVDDGLASGFTMLTAVTAIRNAGAARVALAVPTAHSGAARRLALEVDALYCANLRAGPVFAVADAYEHWHDVSEQELERLLAQRGRALGLMSPTVPKSD
jgi:putative phosphoribosyl transferase